MTNKKRDWVRIIGITGATLVLAGGITMGALRVASASGLVTLPGRPAGMMGARSMGGWFGMNGHDMKQGRRSQNGMMDGRSGRGMMNGLDQDTQGMMGGAGERGMMHGGAYQSQTGDTRILQHVIVILQNEQLSATAIGAKESAAKTIAATRSAQITAIQALQTKWYPDAQVVTPPSAGNATSRDELRQLMMHHSQILEQINSTATYEHPELAAWVTSTLATRATEMTTLYSK